MDEDTRVQKARHFRFKLMTRMFYMNPDEAVKKPIKKKDLVIHPTTDGSNPPGTESKMLTPSS